MRVFSSSSSSSSSRRHHVSGHLPRVLPHGISQPREAQAQEHSLPPLLQVTPHHHSALRARFSWNVSDKLSFRLKSSVSYLRLVFLFMQSVMDGFLWLRGRRISQRATLPTESQQIIEFTVAEKSGKPPGIIRSRPETLVWMFETLKCCLFLSFNEDQAGLGLRFLVSFYLRIFYFFLYF